MKKLYISFKLKYEKKSKNYARVFIFRDKETMYKFFDEQKVYSNTKQPKSVSAGDDKDWEHDFVAMFQAFKTYDFKPKKRGKLKNHMGNLLFYADKTGSGVVAHECGHAALYWYSEKNPHKKEWKVIENIYKEEELLYTLGYLVAQFWTNWFKNQKEIEA